MIPRWVHRLYAWVCGFYWLPCPLCGQHFGGHEWHDGDSLVLHSTHCDTCGSGFLHAQGVCHACGPEARRLNAERWPNAPRPVV